MSTCIRSIKIRPKFINNFKMSTTGNKTEAKI